MQRSTLQSPRSTKRRWRFKNFSPPWMRVLFYRRKVLSKPRKGQSSSSTSCKLIAATLVPIPPNQEEEDQRMEDAWTCDQAQNCHEVWWFVRLSKVQQWWWGRRREISQARLYEGPDRTLVASARNALHKARLHINSESSRILEHLMHNLFRSC